MHYMHLKKGSNDQVIITMQFLGKNYPKSIYGVGNFKNDQVDKKSEDLQGANCKMTKLQFIEGPNAKMHLTMMISSSSYPKFIYGMPLFAKMVKFRFEFEFKFKFELNQKRKNKRKRKKEVAQATWASLGRTGPNFTLHGPPGLSPHAA